MCYKNRDLIKPIIFYAISFILYSASQHKIFALDRSDWLWLSKPEIQKDEVTRALNEIWMSPDSNALNIVYELEMVKNITSNEGNYTSLLLKSVALEHAGDTSAVSSYKLLTEEAKSTPYAASAAFRLRLLEDRKASIPKEIEKIYELLAKEPDGWFLVDNQWIWNTKTIALQKLIELRADKLSFRFFHFLWSKSTFPVPYAYLFIFLVLTIGIKILELPLFVRSAKLAAHLDYLLPQIELIKTSAIDPSEAQQRINQLYKTEGVNPMSGCAVLIVDLIFVIWALIALSSFSPRFILDDAKFLWISDITQRDFRLLLCWTGFSTFQSFITGVSQKVYKMLGQSPAQSCGGTLFGSLIIVFIAWYWKWPAYVIIFWLMLGALGLFIHIVLRIVVRK